LLPGKRKRKKGKRGMCRRKKKNERKMKGLWAHDDLKELVSLSLSLSLSLTTSKSSSLSLSLSLSLTTSKSSSFSLSLSLSLTTSKSSSPAETARVVATRKLSVSLEYLQRAVKRAVKCCYQRAAKH
jgi:outer membrane usher protein FimD/PapC